MALACDFSLVDDGTNKQEIKKENKKEERKVLKFDKEVVKKIMVEEGYSVLMARTTIARLSELDAKLQPILDSYVSDRSLYTDFTIEDANIKTVMDWAGCDFWNGITMMQLYLEKPESTKELQGWSPHQEFLKMKD